MLAYRPCGSRKVGQIGEHAPAAGAPPTGHDDADDLHGSVDNHAHQTAPQVMPREPAVRLATTATITIAGSVGDRLAMLIQGFRNWRNDRGQDDTTQRKTMRGTGPLPKCVGFVPLFLCAPNKGGLPTNNARWRARGGLQTTLDPSNKSRQSPLIPVR